MNAPDVPTGPFVPTTPLPPRGSRASTDHPTTIGRYRVERVLGRGSFGQVYLATDDQLCRQVAVKVPHRDCHADTADAEAYLAEARVVASLDHPHIVPVHDVGITADGSPYVVSKYISGSDLNRRLCAGRLTFRESAVLVADIAEALHYAHRNGLVHRDVKPGNILIDAAGKAYLADFGLALREEDVGKGPGGAGTPDYMSPEQARGEGHRADGRSDVFSLGVVFYELLTGRRPFRGETASELLDQIQSLEPRPPRQVDDNIPVQLERICHKALAKRPLERYSTAKDMADELRDFVTNDLTIEANATIVSRPRNGRPRRTRARIWACGTLLASFAVALYVFGRPASPKSEPNRLTSLSSEPGLPLANLVPDKPVAEQFHFMWRGGRPAIYKDQERSVRDGAPVIFRYPDGETRRGFPMSNIIDPLKDDVCAFNETCAFEFELQPTTGTPWARVDGIDVIVHDYKPLPEYWMQSLLGGGAEYTHVYFVQIEDLSLTKNRRFSASFMYDYEIETNPNSKDNRVITRRKELAFVRLAEKAPQSFLVRVNVKTPGVYTFSAFVRLSYRDNSQELQIVKSTFLFDKPKKPNP